jgi:hypothetical protein
MAMGISSVRQSLVSVAVDGDFVCGNGPKPVFPPKPKLEVVSKGLLRNILSANRGSFTGGSFEDRPSKESLTNRVCDRLKQVNTQTQRYLTEANDGEVRVAGLLSDYKSLLQEMRK